MATLEIPDWGLQWKNYPARCKAAYGGRGSSKTYTVATVLVVMAAERCIRVACAREFQTSIQQSAKRAIESAIHRAGLTDIFDIQKNAIVCKTTGSLFFFVGFERNRESMRGWEDIDIVWIEEAQRLTKESHIVMHPSVRKPGSELWFTFNPYQRSDPVWQDFCSAHPRDDAMIVKVNYYDNPWFPDELEKERLICMEREPELYAHIWLGETLDDGSIRKVLSFALAELCVDAHKKLGWSYDGQRRHVGLDVADTGPDKNCAAIRFGSMITDVSSWVAPTTWETAMRVDGICLENRVSRLYYDGGGVGSGIRGFMQKTRGARMYSTHPINFGSAVRSPEKRYSYKVTNKDMFARRNSQLGWALRARAENTRRALNGEDVSLDHCLFIDGSIPDLEDYLIQLSQPEWKENSAGRIVIDKQPDDAPSPDKYDATVLAFTRDSQYGLKLHT